MGCSSVIILDSHAWIWWVNESDRLSKKAQDAIQETDKISVSAISCWEIAMLVAKERIGFSVDVQEDHVLNCCLLHLKLRCVRRN